VNNFEEVDVVITTFELTTQLSKAVQSVLCQTHPIKSIIIVDDGSDEETLDYLRREILPIPNVKLIFNHHTSLPGVGRYKGTIESDARWIAFLDGDDWWEPEKIWLQMEYARCVRARAVSTNAIVWQDDLPNRRYLEVVPRVVGNKILLADNKIINSSLIVERKLLEQISWYADSFQVRSVEDYATALRISALTDIHFLNCDLVNYFESPNSIRKSNKKDPRVHALSDFLLWINTDSEIKNSTRRILRKRVIAAMRKI
jgi:teichuronic acid biosynthesis glycosyltransferase TuaG